jgi:predicted CXXCH cytochrome family protein
MKKVLVLVAAISLFAAPAFAAGITNTKHNLSASSSNTYKADTNTELCVFCHTPHGGVIGGNAPLWNRTNVAGTLTLYNSATLDQTNSNPATVSAAILDSDAPLCLSCHDGASLTGALKNPSNAFTVAENTSGLAEIGSGMALIGNDLSNDHPIGMDYGNVATASGATEFVAPTLAATGDTVGTVNPLNLYGPSGNSVMWCSSCHDVHNGANAPFLAAANTGSALCLTCHVK